MIEYWKIIIIDSLAIYKNNFTLFLTYAFLIFGVSLIGLYLVSDLKEGHTLFWVYSIGFLVLSFGLSLGFLKIIYDLVKGHHPSIKDIIVGFNYLLKFIGPYCLIIIPAIMIMMVLSGSSNAISPLWIILIIGIIAMLIALFFYPIIIIHKHNLTISDSVKESLNMIRNNFGIIIQFILFFIIGALLFQMILASLFALIGLGDLASLGSDSPSLKTISIIMEFIEHLLITPLVGIIYVKLYIQLSQLSDVEIQESSS